MVTVGRIANRDRQCHTPSLSSPLPSRHHRRRRPRPAPSPPLTPRQRDHPTNAGHVDHPHVDHPRVDHATSTTPAPSTPASTTTPVNRPRRRHVTSPIGARRPATSRPSTSTASHPNNNNNEERWTRRRRGTTTPATTTSHVDQPVLLDEVFSLDSCPIRILYEGGQLSSGQFTMHFHMRLY